MTVTVFRFVLSTQNTLSTHSPTHSLNAVIRFRCFVAGQDVSDCCYKRLEQCVVAWTMYSIVLYNVFYCNTILYYGTNFEKGTVCFSLLKYFHLHSHDEQNFKIDAITSMH